MYGFSKLVFVTLCLCAPTQLEDGAWCVPSCMVSEGHVVSVWKIFFFDDGHGGSNLPKTFSRRHVNYTRCKEFLSERLKKYWLRRRKKSVLCSDGELCWIDQCTCYFLSSCWFFSHEIYTQMVRVWMLSFCVVCVPLVFLGTVCLATIRIIAPNGGERLRCCCEMLLLVSMWQGSETNIIALVSWASWCLGLHCGSLAGCRTMTWLAVCLAQRDWRVGKLLFLTGLIYVAPVFGKRGSDQDLTGSAKKKGKAEVMKQCTESSKNASATAENSARDSDLALQQSLELARATVASQAARRNATDRDSELTLEFPFVPDLLLGVFLSYYGTACLRTILESEWAPTLHLWSEFRIEYEGMRGFGAHVEQTMVSEYLRRFATIHAQQIVRDKSDVERKRELRGENKWIGPVRVNGDCLIAALLEELVYEASLLPVDVLTNQLTYDALCDECRQALVALPEEDARRPRERDVVTGAVRADVDESAHDSAYLQVDVHAEFILKFFLDRYEVPFPNQGLRVTEFTRFDDVLGAAASHVYCHGDAAALAEEAVELWIYNSTGEGICGYHYEPVFMKRALPPPPAAPEGPARKRKQPAAESKAMLAPMAGKVEGVSEDSLTFYRIRALSSEARVAHGDPRESLHNALKFVASQIRDDPTVPANMTDPSVADENALRDDVAVELPAKHCGFIGCAFGCDSDEALERHLQERRCSLGCKLSGRVLTSSKSFAWSSSCSRASLELMVLIHVLCAFSTSEICSSA